MASRRIQTGIRFEQELLEKVTYIAKQNKRSFNAQMEFLAEELVREYEAKNGSIILKKNENDET